MFKIIILIAIYVCLFGCQRFCDSAHQSLDKGAASLTVRWECQKTNCIHDTINTLVDKSVCKAHPENTDTRLAGSLVCSAATYALAGIGSYVIAKKCSCNVMLVFNDLKYPAALCSLFSVLP